MTRLTVAQAQEMGIIEKPKAKKAVRRSAARWDVRKMQNGVMFIIPENMPSLNEWGNWHWSRQREYKQMLTNALSILAMKVGKPYYEKARIKIVHYHRVKRRRDEDNLTPKMLLDSLRYAGVIQDDNVDVLELLSLGFEIDREKWRTEVFVWGVK